MKKNISIVLASLFAFSAMIANAQTTTTTTTTATSDFRKDVEAAKAVLQSDPQALAMTQDVNAEDSEDAGDANGSSVAIDGEEPEDQINGEIEDEIDSESESVDQSSADSSDASTTDMTTSGDTGTSENGN